MRQTGLYYYHARYYDPRMSMFYGVDPHAENYMSFSPYAYVGNNPLIRIDPDGRDIWEIDNKGFVVNRFANDVTIMHLVDSDGNKVEGANVSFDRKVIETYRTSSTTYHDRETNKQEVTQVDIYRVRGDDNATKIFEFMADNTNVEWSQFKTGTEGDKGLNFLSTGHIAYTEPGAAYLINFQLKDNYTIREHIHNHPSNRAIPSGLIPGGRPGDIGFARAVENWYSGAYPERRNVPNFMIYTSNPRNYTRYSGRSDYCNFHPCITITP